MDALGSIVSRVDNLQDIVNKEKKSKEGETGMRRWKQGLFYFFFKVTNKCWCPLVFYVLLGILESAEMLIILFHFEAKTFNGDLPAYLQGVSKVLSTYLVPVLFFNSRDFDGL